MTVYTSFISADGKIWNTSENIICLKVYTIANSIQSSDLVKYYKMLQKFSANVNAANVNVTFNINESITQKPVMKMEQLSKY